MDIFEAVKAMKEAHPMIEAEVLGFIRHIEKKYYCSISSIEIQRSDVFGKRLPETIGVKVEVRW